jgi:ferrous iron transport protein B
MMELPPYHLPTLKGVLLRTWDRVKLFIREAGKIIVVMVLALNLLNSIGTDGSFGNEDSDRSVLSVASQTLTPVFAPMGIHQDNWPAVVGIISGVLAKEVVVGTLDTLYTRLAEEESGSGAGETEFDLWQALKGAAATVPENLSGLGELLTDPLGLGAADVRDINQVVAEQEVSMDVFGAMAARFDGQVGAFAYLLFVLLYFPCVATIGAIKREAGGSWAAFVAFWTTSVAYVTASVWYQSATWSQHPGSSALWISLLLGYLLLIILGLKRWVNREKPALVTPVVERG